MKIQFFCILGALSLVATSCKKDNQNDDVISQRYIHKYGYAVSQDEWNVKKYPGQVLTSLRNGVTVTETYENGTLHGPTTRTYPHSQVVEAYALYNQGHLVKETFYDVKGMPMRERVQLSPTRFALTLWYADGTPKSVEEYTGIELLEGQYFTMTNEIESRVEKGSGKRVIRDEKGTLVVIDEIVRGYVTKHESFFANGAPESIIHYDHGKFHGEKRMYAQTGEPLAIEEWVNGKLHGKSTYFKNGTRTVEISYLDGMKNGLEIHFVDGETISQQIPWSNDLKQGIATYFIDANPHYEYYYGGKKMSLKDYEENMHMDEMISQIPNELRATY
jgi:antitoxin component YwqK of YwqJK toxin-antitoxin module